MEKKNYKESLAKNVIYISAFASNFARNCPYSVFPLIYSIRGQISPIYQRVFPQPRASNYQQNVKIISLNWFKWRKKNPLTDYHFFFTKTRTIKGRFIIGFLDARWESRLYYPAGVLIRVEIRIHTYLITYHYTRYWVSQK